MKYSTGFRTAAGIQATQNPLFQIHQIGGSLLFRDLGKISKRNC